MEQDLIFILERETKNCYRFKEVPANGQPPIIGTLYVQKWAFSTPVKGVAVKLVAQDGTDEQG